MYPEIAEGPVSDHEGCHEAFGMLQGVVNVGLATHLRVTRGLEYQKCHQSRHYSYFCREKEITKKEQIGRHTNQGFCAGDPPAFPHDVHIPHHPALRAARVCGENR
eukprot:556996-Amorphochlora_amoeboformis.AAC.2